MKKLWVLALCTLVLGTLSVSTLLLTDGADQGKTGIDQPYEFPVLPGTDDWKELKNAEEKRAACAVPRETLEQMSTAALVETVCRYPLFSDVYAYGNARLGLKAVSGYFAGIDVLKSRSDALACLQAFAAEETERTESTDIRYFNADFLLKNLFCTNEYQIPSFEIGPVAPTAAELEEKIAAGFAAMNGGSALKTGTFVSQGKNAYFRVLTHAEDGTYRIGPNLPESGVICSCLAEKEKGRLIVGGFTFEIVDEKTLRYVQADDPNTAQRQIQDQTLFVLEE